MHRAFTLDDSIVCRCSEDSDHALIRADGSFPDRSEVRELAEQAPTESEAPGTPPGHFRQSSLPLINYITPPGPDLRPYTVAPTESETP